MPGVLAVLKEQAELSRSWTLRSRQIKVTRDDPDAREAIYTFTPDFSFIALPETQSRISIGETTMRLGNETPTR
jgi:hypothetical protein